MLAVAQAAVHVALHLHHAILVIDDYRYRVVAVQDTQYQTHVSILVCRLQAVHCIGPRLHLVALLGLQVAHKVVAYHKRSYAQEHSHRNKQDFDLLDSICPLHGLSFMLITSVTLCLLYKILYLCRRYD